MRRNIQRWQRNIGGTIGQSRASPNIYVLVYLDNILIFSNNMADHKMHVKEVLWCLQKHELFVNGAECCFHSDSVEYLGYIIGSSSLCMDSTKVQVIQDWPRPKKVKDVQSFLGFANFYRCFIHGYVRLPGDRIALGIPQQFSGGLQGRERH